jgi:hypothetical protein
LREHEEKGAENITIMEKDRKGSLQQRLSRNCLRNRSKALTEKYNLKQKRGEVQ